MESAAACAAIVLSARCRFDESGDSTTPTLGAALGAPVPCPVRCACPVGSSSNSSKIINKGMKRQLYKTPYAGPISRRTLAYRRRISQGTRSRWAMRRQMGVRAPNPRTGGYYGRYKYGLSTASPEMKFYDGTANFALVDTGGEIEDSICEIAQGITEKTRVGRKIQIKKISLRITFSLPSTQAIAETSDVVRLLVYLDRQCNGATAAVTDILETADDMSFNNLANKGRFSVLMDKKVGLDSTGGSWDGTHSQFVSVNKFKDRYLTTDIPVEFDGPTGAITEIKSNNIGLLAISGAGYAAMIVHYRIRYFDA